VARQLGEAGHTLAQIAKVLGYGSVRGITRLKAFFGLPEAVLELGKTKPERFSAEMAELLQHAVKAIGEEKTRALLERAFAENLSMREMANRVRLQTRQTRQRRSSSFNISLGEENVGNLSVWKMADRKGKIQLSVVLDASLTRELSGQLDALLRNFMATKEADYAGKAGHENT
jgi:hypothetical protein